MASLNKLAVRGIRSFDDKQISVIEFFSPVTVIVGHNGSGKTTIIECLKYATTGDQPPNTRGGAFVHDPKMANEKEVKAQVKLRFHAANGQRMLAVRNLSVTAKKTGALTMKTLESILGLDDDSKGTGKRAVISTKCAEMDIEIPRLLGVSKAVLENVIFCHQEDSYWPLSEPSVLKKKFDDIFEATKYTKALDSIKSLRKDRVAELKAEKERLEGLSREKGHADKLRARVSDLTRSIASKEVEYDEMKGEYQRLVVTNQRFFDSASSFREVFARAEELDKEMRRYREELDTTRETLRELPGTDEELADRLRNFDSHIAEQKRKRKQEEDKLQDLEEELVSARKTHADKLTDRGQLEAEVNAQEQRLAERETFIRELSAKHNMKGYEHSPLARERVLEFITRLLDMKNRHNTETERLQLEHKSKNDEYNAEARQLHGELASLQSQKEAGKGRIVSLSASITKFEQQLDVTEELTSKAKTIEGDIEEKERRLQRIRDDTKAANYEGRLAENMTKLRTLDVKKSELDKEITSLSLQADSRARLDLKREGMRTKASEVRNILEINNPRFRKLAGVDAHSETMERDVERVIAEKEREHAELENLSDKSRKELSAIESTLSRLKEQVKTKKQQVKKLEQQVQEGIKNIEGCTTATEALEAAKQELAAREAELKAVHIWKELLKNGRTKKCCPLCSRNMNDKDMATYEKNVTYEIEKATVESLKKTEQEVKDWMEAVADLQALAIVDAECDKMKKTEIPAMEKEIREKEDQLSEASEKAQEASERWNLLKRELRELSALKQHAVSVSRTQQEIHRLEREIATLESELLSTGSTKTVEDVQEELNTLNGERTVLERERQSLVAEKERQSSSLRTHENDLHALQLNLSEVKSQLRDKSTLEKRIAEMRQEVADAAAQLKAIDAKIADVEPVVQRLELGHKQIDSELAQKISEAQRVSQDLNVSADKLEGYNRAIERYVKERRGRLLKDTVAQIEALELEMQQSTSQLEDVRASIHSIDKEIGAGDASMANLRENLRARKLVKSITTIQKEIESCNLDQAAEDKRKFNEKYQKDKERETELQAKYAHLGGELSSVKQQLREQEKDLEEFKDINRRYRDQLIKVKMSDMANNDLEKYAKALDNAIMKYHSLKMQEVNDTMRHLWSKTYRGTDIDSIKISSDSEGGVTKRSYNYRVVMTKDNVEMDMRGRCSAGQKMLASIIIRLALADSFGQNCGILALDEPTNALDMENIQALAASLVGLIEERRRQANFQLIVITHDENFLQQLGATEAVDRYWRVSRDSRQKSIIERHRLHENSKS